MDEYGVECDQESEDQIDPKPIGWQGMPLAGWFRWIDDIVISSLYRFLFAIQ
jgi:hypothetical protein